MTYFDWTLAIFAVAIIVGVIYVGQKSLQGEETAVGNPYIFGGIAIIVLGGLFIYFLYRLGWLEALNNWHPF